jgi:hypothetical protein
MKPTGLLPWERLLLIAALVVGVLTMHATPIICPPDSADGHLSAGPAHGHSATVLTGEYNEGAECGGHHALAACLAILGVGLLVVALRLVCRVPGAVTSRTRAVLAVAAAAARAPPRPSTDLLAELCVSRR